LSGRIQIKDGAMCTIDTNAKKIVYWHRELPPLDADAVAEHIVEATSARVAGTLLHRDELWALCYEDLMAKAIRRLEQEVVRLGGNCAHVLEESVDSRQDGATAESWLHGRFTYMLYRQPQKKVSLNCKPEGDDQSLTKQN
jgi:hypothetical protein